ncbi:hypothetical protein [Cylindrospermum sp. FACHB-282]|uniref:hypothetical protein n=1 Tax=Cylindrospermum sp. FACHB-282 TaxID=2692794 RepID=UPI001688A96D|nr:hypothetical protein [Cylindrospermum sp. FACHB-282]MBD2385151.1 hypothetical protein [Cylindrospermum sp. FACHB-282]
MKIVEETHTRLVIQQKPISNWITGGLIFTAGLSFLIYCILFDFASARLTCTRSLPKEINCELKRFSLLGKKDQLKIFDPQQAQIITTRGSRGGETHQVVVTSSFGYIVLLPHASYQANQSAASEINNFINSEQTSLLVLQNQREYLSYLSLLFLFVIAIGAFLCTSPVSTCTFYKSLNQVFIERKGLRGEAIIKYSLLSILDFEIQDKQFKYKKLYRAVILLKFGTEIPINVEYTDENSVRYVVLRIRQFLSLQQFSDQ